MNARFITYVIIGVAFGFTQLWFVYWVVKLFKEKQRILKERRTGAAAAPSVQSTAGSPPADRQERGSTLGEGRNRPGTPSAAGQA